MEIWSFIKEHDNGITNFHFEISADLLEEDELEFLTTLRPGRVQFEIGVQSTNPDTIAAIHRNMDYGKLSRNVLRIKEGRNIHVHLDLIAGLPLEGYASFEKSFQDVYQLRPDQLQLGFLKLLKGSLMEEEQKVYGITCRSTPPYEVLYTDQLTYEEVLAIKGACEMVEIYYNSGQFTAAIRFLEQYYVSPMKLYQAIHEYYDRKTIGLMAHSRIKRYEILLDFYIEVVLESVAAEDRPDLEELFKEILIYDLYLREDLKSRPSFCTDKPKKNQLKALYEKYQADRGSIHIELFSFDVEASAAGGTAVRKETAILFDYGSRDPISYGAKTEKLEL
jgi:tetratricopeptide (TPR) repeat protein